MLSGLKRSNSLQLQTRSTQIFYVHQFLVDLHGKNSSLTTFLILTTLKRWTALSFLSTILVCVFTCVFMVCLLFSGHFPASTEAKKNNLLSEVCWVMVVFPPT